MRFSQRLVELKRFSSGRLCAGHGLVRRQDAIEAEQVVTVCESRIGQAILWIRLYGFFKVVDSFFQTLAGSLVPVESPPQIKRIGLRAPGIPFGDQVPLLECDSQPELF